MLEQQLRAGKGARQLKLSSTLENIGRKQKLSAIRPLIKNFKAKRERTKALLNKDKARLTAREKHLLRRLGRAPRGAKVPDLGRIYMIELQPGRSEAQAVREFSADPDVEYAELNYVATLYATPNDPNYAEQWALNNTGQQYPIHGGQTSSGTSGCDVNAPEAWDIRTDCNQVIVAMIDSGVDYNHADLADNMWTDANGYYGYDFYDNDNDPMDELGHGTHCAGVIAAVGDNDTDVTGLCWQAKIMAIKTSGPYPWYATDAAFKGIVYAVDNGADVLSCSWGGAGQALEEVINYAYSQGAIIVAAAGNITPYQPFVAYPAAFYAVISVAATNSDDERALFSNYGDWIDVAAPGQDILSLRAYGTDAYQKFDPRFYRPGDAFYPYGDPNATMYIASGTSTACPHVSGLAALCLADDPNLKAEDIRLLIKLNAHDINEPNLGAGRIDAYSTLNAIPPNFPDPNQATEPDPCDDANFVSINTDLSWTADELASSHDLYFGTDFNDVNDANTSSAVFKGELPGPWFDLGGLDQNTTYYWRVDERNYNAWTKGDVWSFTTRNGSIIYVDTDANDGGDGLSWATAFNRLEDAFDVAVNDEIWVAEGTYVPDTNSFAVSFEPPQNTKLYGGFAGTESSRDERDPNLAANLTILSGNINDPNDPNDNCWHVILGSNRLVLDRFTITAGYARGSWNQQSARGGGMYNVAVGWLTISDCTFTENMAQSYGGAIYNYYVNIITLHNCKFVANKASGAESGYGGAVFNKFASLAVGNCLFSANWAERNGGACWVAASNATFANSLFSGNEGGALHMTYVNAWSPQLIDNCTFIKNTKWWGGAIYIENSSPCVATNSIFWGNEAPGGGDEVYIKDGELTFSFCCLRGGLNGSHFGGVDANDGGGNIDEDPCFVNYFDLSDLTTEAATTTTLKVADANLYAVDDVIEYDDDGVGRTVTDVNTQTQTITFGTPLDANSQPYMRVFNWGVGVTDVDEDFHLKYASECIEKGDPNGNYTGQKDIDGEDRVMDGDGDCNDVVDMGADEAYFPPCWNYDTQCYGDADGDGYVGAADNQALQDSWYEEYGDPNYNPCADFDRNGEVKGSDFLILKDNLETYPDPNCECGGTWPPQ
jgi:subtilisin family serine protease